MGVIVFRPSQLEAALEAVTAAGNTTHSIGVVHRTAIEQPHSSTEGLPAVIRRLIVKPASANRETGRSKPIVRAMVHRVGSSQVPAIAPAAAEVVIVSGAEVHHRVPAIAPAAEQELEIEAHHRAFHRVRPREVAVEEEAEALVGDPAV
jgi:hypothetical protein